MSFSSPFSVSMHWRLQVSTSYCVYCVRWILWCHESCSSNLITLINTYNLNELRRFCVGHYKKHKPFFLIVQCFHPWLVGLWPWLHKNWWVDFHKTLMEDGSQPRIDPVHFWCRSRKREPGFFSITFLTLRNTFLPHFPKFLREWHMDLDKHLIGSMDIYQ